MEVIDEWTRRHACALQAALRMTQEEFARRLRVAKRTVTSWHEQPDGKLRGDQQRGLDDLYEEAGDAVKVRFARQLKADDASIISTNAASLTVAIAIVVDGDHVLVVCRRDDDGSGITWQFPAGIVKPGASAKTTAVRETLGETAIHCSVRTQLGSRLHPITSVYCEYFLCDYLAGDVENKDQSENVSAMWIPRSDLTRFIPADKVFPPALEALETLNG
jgi:8-oxo-dGTP pyrophosphatase MutT (NUDIX family)